MTDRTDEDLCEVVGEALAWTAGKFEDEAQTALDELQARLARLRAVADAARAVAGYGADSVGRYGLGSWADMWDALRALDEEQT